MAITQNPLIGAASGKFAGAVFSRSFGKNIIRSMPVEVSDANTDAQKLVRQKFTAAAEAIRAGLSFWKETYKDVQLGGPVFSHLVGYAYKNATSGDLDSVVVDYGELSPSGTNTMSGADITVDKLTEDQITIDYSAANLADKIGADGEITALVIDEATGEQTMQLTPTSPADGEIVVPVNGDPDGKTYQIYLVPKKHISKFKPAADLVSSVK